MLLATAESLLGESRVSGVLETIRRCLGDTELIYVADGALAVARPLCFADSRVHWSLTARLRRSGRLPPRMYAPLIYRRASERPCVMKKRAGSSSRLQSSVPGDHLALRMLSVPCLAHVAWVPPCPSCAELPQAHPAVRRCGKLGGDYS